LFVYSYVFSFINYILTEKQKVDTGRVHFLGYISEGVALYVFLKRQKLFRIREEGRFFDGDVHFSTLTEKNLTSTK